MLGVEIESDFDGNLLMINGYQLEIEKNTVKSRSGIFVSNDISYSRNVILEGINSHLVIIDIEGDSDIKQSCCDKM